MSELRMLLESASRTADLGDELHAETTALSFIEPCRSQKLNFRFRVKDDTLHRRAARALRKTPAAALPLTFPARSSSKRRSASRTHTTSASASTSSSRLEMRRSARRARSRGESFRALDSI